MFQNRPYVKRREVLKSLGVGVTAGLALPWLSSCTDDTPSGPEVPYSGVVAIVGAGAAGLAVADYLTTKGIKVKIFEASNRIGGRVVALKQSDPLYNDLAADFPLELGADRIFGSNSEFGNMVKLLKQQTLPFQEAIAGSQDYYMINNQYKSLADIQADSGLNAAFTALKNFKDNLPGYAGGGSIEAAAGASAQFNGVLNSWLGNAYGSSANRIGADGMGEALAMIEHDGQELVLKKNTLGNILSYRFDKIAKGVQLNNAVTAVAYSGSEVTLTIKNTADNSQTTETFGKVVVTSPVAVLNDPSRITFSPALPASKTSALSRIGMDASIRMVIEFTRNDFFGPNPVFIFGGVECPSYFFAGVGRSKLNRTLCLTINGSKAEELSQLSDEDKVANILAEMDVMFDGKASENARRSLDDIGTVLCVVQDWTKEPYIQGGQSYPKVGGTNADRIALAEPVNKMLYFAGEATDITGEFGTISGALKSGKRAAEEIVTDILEENGV